MATTGIINTKTNSKSKSLVTDASMPKTQLSKNTTNRLDHSTSYKNNTTPFY
ncbi:hypothetical protein KSF78_0001180 [Schistosoma japonicum]|nr:hypothetical protein KSF78_0001180 [Schistosoma japonicum]